MTTCQRLQRLPALLLVLISLNSCYQYKVLNTIHDPGTEVQKKVMWSYAWGLVNKPKDLKVPNCLDSTALSEVTYSKRFGHSILTFMTIGILSPVEIQWKCTKPIPKVGGF